MNKRIKRFPEHGNITQLKRVKFGIDPTGSELHLGHLVPLRIVRELHEQKKEITLVIGTFTALLGDPTGQEKTRPILTETQVRYNADKLTNQIIKFLGFTPKVIENHTFAERSSIAHFLRDVTSQFTVAELMARENFKTRSVALHELLVPLIQAMDSVLLETEIEIGGNDQEVNFSLTRKLQTHFNQKPEIGLLCPVLQGTTGTKKMSKSAGNCIFLSDSTKEIQNKILNMSDLVLDEWLTLLTDIKEFPEDPRIKKQILIQEIIKQCAP
jgi:tyrosyl-tRNA synthetase